MIHRLPLPGVLAVLAALLAACGSGSPAGTDPPNVLVVLVDTLRADRLGVYGNPRGLTPFLDELARTGTVFANAYAPSSWTCPSVASLFTSRYASQHHVDSFEATLAPSEVTLAEVLAERDYTSAGFSANLRMLKSLGYAQGFDVWEAYLPTTTGGTKPRGSYLRRASVRWVQGLAHSTRRRPAFVYLQYMEPHHPYEPVEPYRSRFVEHRDGVDETVAQRKLSAGGRGKRDLSDAEIEVLASLYDGEVASADAEIRALFDELGRSGFLRNAVIVITADHGEEFGEHGELLHGFTLYNGIIHIPLIIIGPGVAAGRVVEQNVSLVDVAPTILELLGTPPPPSFEGRSLAPLLRGGIAPAVLWARLVTTREPPDVISEIEPVAGSRFDWRLHTRALMHGSHKLLVTPQDALALYDLTRDPGETQPLSGPSAAEATALHASLEQRRVALQQHSAGRAELQPLDEAAKEKLRALGYQH